jgi:hypothetical protein
VRETQYHGHPSSQSLESSKGRETQGRGKGNWSYRWEGFPEEVTDTWSNSKGPRRVWREESSKGKDSERSQMQQMETPMYTQEQWDVLGRGNSSGLGEDKGLEDRMDDIRWQCGLTRRLWGWED